MPSLSSAKTKEQQSQLTSAAHSPGLINETTALGSSGTVLRLQRAVGNQATSRLIQMKLKVSTSGDYLEREADRVADQVTNPLGFRNQSHAISLNTPDADGAEQHKLQNVAPGNDAAVNNQQMPGSSGLPLESDTRSWMESRFRRDFGHVRVHDDSSSGEMAHALNARAFTIGSHLFMGKGQYAPTTTAGRHLLAHELTHVIQKHSKLRIQRQVIPQRLKQSLNLQTLSDEELIARYDLIVSTVQSFSSSTPDTALLENEAGDIGVELSRRKSLAAGRTFSGEAIDRMRQYFTENAKSDAPESCIACMNKGLRLLLGDPKQKMGSEVDKSMAKLGTSGRAGAGRVIEFEDKKGRITTGTLRPETLHESVWDVVVEMSGGDPGWSVFGMSLLDGYHSVTLTLDNNSPATPVIYWSDQWNTKGGWKEYKRAELDAEVTHLTQAWWDKQPENRKHNTKTTLWRLRQ